MQQSIPGPWLAGRLRVGNDFTYEAGGLDFMSPDPSSQADWIGRTAHKTHGTGSRLTIAPSLTMTRSWACKPPFF